MWRTASIVARARQRASVAPAGLTSDPFRCQFLLRAFLNVVAAVANGPARGNSPVCEPRLIWGGRTTRLSAPCDRRAVPKSGAARSNQCGAAVASLDWRQPGERSSPRNGIYAAPRERLSSERESASETPRGRRREVEDAQEAVPDSDVYGRSGSPAPIGRSARSVNRRPARGCGKAATAIGCLRRATPPTGTSRPYVEVDPRPPAECGTEPWTVQPEEETTRGARPRGKRRGRPFLSETARRCARRPSQRPSILPLEHRGESRRRTSCYMQKSETLPLPARAAVRRRRFPGRATGREQLVTSIIEPPPSPDPHPPVPAPDPTPSPPPEPPDPSPPPTPEPDPRPI